MYFLETPTAQLFKKIAAFIGSAGSVPCLQQQATISFLEIN